MKPVERHLKSVQAHHLVVDGHEMIAIGAFNLDQTIRRLTRLLRLPVQEAQTKGRVGGGIHLSNWSSTSRVAFADIEGRPSWTQVRDGAERGAILLIDTAARAASWAGHSDVLAWLSQQANWSKKLVRHKPVEKPE